MITVSNSLLELPRSILVLDDERAFCDVVSVILESQGYRVRRAHHANQALGLMDESKPDLILSDVMMPEVDGFRFLEHVRQRPDWSDIPVVMISAYDEPEIQEHAMKAGASGFISKPFSATELRDSVGTYLRDD